MSWSDDGLLIEKSLGREEFKSVVSRLISLSTQASQKALCQSAEEAGGPLMR